MSCVPLPRVWSHRGMRWYLVNSLVPMNVKTTTPALPENSFFSKFSAVSEMSRLFIDALWCQFVSLVNAVPTGKMTVNCIFYVCNISLLPISLQPTPAILKSLIHLLPVDTNTSPSFNTTTSTKHHCLIGNDIVKCLLGAEQVILDLTLLCIIAASLCWGDNEPLSCSPHGVPFWNQNYPHFGLIWWEKGNYAEFRESQKLWGTEASGRVSEHVMNLYLLCVVYSVKTLNPQHRVIECCTIMFPEAADP